MGCSKSNETKKQPQPLATVSLNTYSQMHVQIEYPVVYVQNLIPTLASKNIQATPKAN